MLSGPGALLESRVCSSLHMPFVVMSRWGISGKGLCCMWGVSMFSCVNTDWK